MRGGILLHAVAARTPKSLVVRGGLVRTFGSLATFLAVAFLCSGIYILEDTLANPIAAQAAALIAGAFSTALAAILIYYLIRPRKKVGLAVQERPPAAVSPPGTQFFDEVLPDERQNDSRKDLVYQRLYVDRSRIRP